MYVIQERFREWEKWRTLKGRYETLAEAQAALDKLPFKSTCRIAEEYTIIRYKAVSANKSKGGPK